MDKAKVLRQRQIAKILEKVGKVISFFFKIVMFFIFAFPFYYMVIMSFLTDAESMAIIPKIWPSTWSFDAYVRVWALHDWLHALQNTVVITFTSMILQLLTMVPSAYAFAKYKFAGQACFAVVMLALMVPTQVTFVATYLMFAEIKIAGVSALYTLLPQILPSGVSAFSIFLLRQSFRQVPEELIESARLDNAGEYKIMFQIMLPMAKNTIFVLMMFSFIGHWNAYFWPSVMTLRDQERPISVALSYINTNVEQTYNVVMAGNSIFVVPIILCYLVLNKQIINGFMYRGIK